MSTRAELVFGIVLGTIVLASAFKLGVIGGGAGASRDENPILFWMGVMITSAATLMAIFILVWTFVH